MITSSDPVSRLPYVGEKTESKLQHVGVRTVGDLLWHLPQRYEDLSHVTTIDKIEPNTVATIRGTVERIATRRSFRKRMTITEMRITDGTGNARAVWFHQPYLEKMFSVGDELYLSGKTQATLLESHFINPVFEKVKQEQIHTGHIVPFYSLTEGVTHKQIRFMMQTALKSIDTIPDELPADIRKAEKFPSLQESLKQIHFPKNFKQLDLAIRRLKFEELFWLQLSVGYARKFYKQNDAPVLQFKEQEVAAFVRGLPFTLTADQKKAAWQILKELGSEKPMNRLLQGDVGSGKTVVAAIATLNTVLNGYQVALMAPTEILALQHFSEFRKLLPHASIALLTSKNSSLNGTGSSKKAISEALVDGTVDCVIGTHALIQEGIAIKQLGLVVIDEQHRFGVEQRKRLGALSLAKKSPHLLSLSATPIPRTLALTLYGDLDIASIREKPQGRKPVVTRIINEAQRTAAYAFIREHIKNGEQIFILCPLIDAHDSNESKSVMKEFERLRDTIFPELELRYLHGRLKSDSKKKIITDFRENKFPLLVTTSVIEVGIDIPQATIMVIEGAERFGLAQLHQFRGRVGRNAMQSYCLLFTGSPRTETLDRLKLFCKEQDGFALAEADLKMRGEGEVFGSRQTGMINFKIATIHDLAIIKKSRSWVDKLLEQDADFSFFQTIKHKLSDRVIVHDE